MDFRRLGRARLRAALLVVVTLLMAGALAPVSVTVATAETAAPTETPTSGVPVDDSTDPTAVPGGEASAPTAVAAESSAASSTDIPADDAPAAGTAMADSAIGSADGVADDSGDDDATDSSDSPLTVQSQSTFATPSAVPSATPGWRQAKIVVRASGDRLANGSVTPLAGVEFELYRTSSASDLRYGWRVDRCTTDAQGRCGVIVDLPYDRHSGSYRGFYYAKQVSAPEGWLHTQTWGSSTQYVRHNTGRLTGGTTVNLPTGTRSWPNVRANPQPSAPVCGPDGEPDRELEVAFVVDLSNSINRYEPPEVFADYKRQATALVDALEGTPTTMSVYTFATDAPAAGAQNGTLSGTSVSTAAGADTVRRKIQSLTEAPTVEEGYANWDEGLAQTIGEGHDVVVLLTDGEPTAHRGAKVGGAPAGLPKVEEAIHSANGVKAEGTRILAVGVTEAASTANRHRLSLLSGPSDPWDYVTVQDLNFAGAVFQAIGRTIAYAAHGDCTSLTVTTRTAGAGGGSAPAPGWALTAELADESRAAPGQVVTGTDGSATFNVGYHPTAPAQRVTITQTQQENHVIRPDDGAHARCTANGASLPVTNTDGGFAVAVPPGAAAACTIVNTPVASTYSPKAAEVKVAFRAGGDRLANDSGGRLTGDVVAGLAGATFDIYRSEAASAVDGGTRVGACTTGDDGTCAVVVSLANPTQGAEFYGVQTAAPDGWTVAERWGGPADAWGNRPPGTRGGPAELVRYSTGRLTGGQTASLPGDTRHWPQVRDNPEMTARCGLDIALVYDLSNSVTTWDEARHFEPYKGAGAAVVDALEGTPSRLALYTYGTHAPAIGSANGGLELTSVARPEGAGTVRDAITGLTATPDVSQGWTNWDLGLAQLPDDLDVVLFLTDGDPTDSRSSQYPVSSNETTLLMMEEAVHSANAVKATGAHLVAVRAGPALDEEASHQRLTLLSDDTRLSDFAELGQLLEHVALQDCAGTVNVVKDVQDTPGGDLAPGEGWEFTAVAAGPGAVSDPVETDADGTASFTVDMSAHAPDPRAVTLTETSREGYAIEPQDGHNAVCAASDDEPVTVTDVEDGFAVEARHDAVITCRVVNAVVPHPAVTIRKAAAAVDPGGGALPWVVAGTEVTWSYTVTNTGNVPLRNVHVTDDRDVEVTCPVTAESPESGNPIAVLAVGESMTCSGTGPVTPTPSP